MEKELNIEELQQISGGLVDGHALMTLLTSAFGPIAREWLAKREFFFIAQKCIEKFGIDNAITQVVIQNLLTPEEIEKLK